MIWRTNLNSQKISRLYFFHCNVVAAGETDIRHIDNKGNSIGYVGSLVSAFVIEKSNGVMSDMAMDGECIFNVTTKKHLGLYDLSQEKKLGSYFNDYRNSE